MCIKCSLAMKEAFKQANDMNVSKFDTMYKIARAFSDNRECSVQEAVYQLMPQLWMRKTYPVVKFVNTNQPEKRFSIVKPEEELLQLPPDSENVYKRNMLDRYMDRPNKTFRDGKYQVLDDMCYAEFQAHYYLDTKNVEDKNDNQPVILTDFLIEESHCQNNYPSPIPLMNSKEKLRCRRVRSVIRFFTPSAQKNPEGFAHHLLQSFYPFRSEEELAVNGSYIQKLDEPNVKDTINQNKLIFEPEGQLVDEAFRSYREDLTHNQDPFGQQENDEILDLIPSDNEQEESGDFVNESLGSNSSSEVIDVLTDININSMICGLNQEQREIFDVIFAWARKHMKNKNCLSPVYNPPLNIFLTGDGGCGKSHLIKTIYYTLSKMLMSHGSDLEKPRLLRLAPTGVASINIGGTTIHTGLGIPIREFLCLSDKQRTRLRNNLADVAIIIIDEISMVSSKLLVHIHQRLGEIYNVPGRIPFAGKTVIVSGDLYQLSPVFGKPVYSSEGYMQTILKLWEKFKLAELKVVMRQQGDPVFIELLNNVRTGKLTKNNMDLLKSRVISKSDPNYPWHVLHLFAENDLVKKHNDALLKVNLNPLYSITCIEDIPREARPSDIESLKHRKQNDTGGLAYCLDIKKDCRVMLTSNIDISDRLINGLLGTVSHIQSNGNKVLKIYVKFDDNKAGEKRLRTDHFAYSTGSVPIERCEAHIKLIQNKVNSPVVKRVQFPLMLAHACTVHKVQGLTLEKAVISFTLSSQKQFNPGQVYVALSRVSSLEGLYLTGNFKESAVVASRAVHEEYERLRRNENILPTIEYYKNTDSTLLVTLLNVRSLMKHSVDYIIMESDVLCFTETQLLPNQNRSDIDTIKDQLAPFDISFNNDNDKYKSLAFCYKKHVRLRDSIEAPGISLMTFRKDSFSQKSFVILLLYRSQTVSLMNFFEFSQFF